MTRIDEHLSRWLCTATLLAGCGGYEVLRVPTGDHPTDAARSGLLETVDYPPPPAKVEETGKAPREECRWRDGYWEWKARRWEWVRGRWIVPPKGCFFAPRVIMVWVAERDGSRLYYGRPRWYRDEARAEPEASCVEPPACKPPADGEK